MNDLVKKLRGIAISKENVDFAYGRKAPLYGKETEIEWEAADHIEAQEKLIEEMREALEIVAGVRPCVDNLLGNADIARLALSKSNPNTPERNDE